MSSREYKHRQEYTQAPPTIRQKNSIHPLFSCICSWEPHWCEWVLRQSHQDFWDDRYQSMVLTFRCLLRQLLASCNEACCFFARCLSLLRQLVASSNEACCSFASCYKAWPTVLRFIARWLKFLSEALLNPLVNTLKTKLPRFSCLFSQCWFLGSYLNTLDFFNVSFGKVIKWHIIHQHCTEMSSKSTVVS